MPIGKKAETFLVNTVNGVRAKYPNDFRREISDEESVNSARQKALKGTNATIVSYLQWNSVEFV